MLTGLDHVLIACANPDSAATDLEARLELRASAGGRHDAHGTFNRLIWLGDSFIELLGVFDADLAAASWWGRHALGVLEAAAARGDPAGYMGLVVASDDLAVDGEVVRSRGSVLGPPEAGSRVRPDGRVVRWQISHAPTADPDLGVFFIIEHDSAAAEWSAEERAVRAAQAQPLGGPARLERVEVPVADMQRATMRVHRDVGLPFRPSLAGGGARDASVGRQTLRLVPARSSITPRIVIRGGPASRELNALGCRWLVEPEVGSG